ncbi:MAG: hypothetical protein ABIJ15_01630 [bacterium]
MVFYYWTIVVLLAVLLVTDTRAAVKEYDEKENLAVFLFHLILLLALLMAVMDLLYKVMSVSFGLPVGL